MTKHALLSNDSSAYSRPQTPRNSHSWDGWMDGWMGGWMGGWMEGDILIDSKHWFQRTNKGLNCLVLKFLNLNPISLLIISSSKTSSQKSGEIKDTLQSEEAEQTDRSQFNGRTTIYSSQPVMRDQWRSIFNFFLHAHLYSSTTRLSLSWWTWTRVSFRDVNARTHDCSNVEAWNLNFLNDETDTFVQIEVG